MSYQALYRRWRPDTFDRITGQDAIVRTLKNQVITDRIGHAYLFCGTRGTGKTSAAKILARAANCPAASGNGGSPCNCCPSCRSILDGSSMNVMEIDAASNNGVDNIRDIREETEYPPVTGRFKVYIIDEVHMLSAGAFNALLKTLEEPPAYVIFILATTDPQKIPATILSRCQRYDFRRIPRRTIYEQLKTISASEGFDIEDRALRYMAEAGDGSMRDAISVLEQCFAYHTDHTLTYDEVLGILGSADNSVYSKLLSQISGRDVYGALGTLGEMVASGADILQLLNDFIWYMRNVMLAGSVGRDRGDLLDISEDTLELAAADAERLDHRLLLEIIGSMSELTNRARFAPQKRVLLEVEIIRLCTSTRVSAQNQPPYGRAFVEEELTRNKETGKAREERKKGDGLEDPEEPLRRAKEHKKTNPAESGTEPEQDRPGAAGSARNVPLRGSSAGDIEVLRSCWQELVAGLHPSNRPLFAGVTLKEEKGVPVLLFRNSMNYRMAAGNIEENGVLKLRSLAAGILGHDIKLMARAARPGEIKAEEQKITDEELARINFHVDIED